MGSNVQMFRAVGVMWTCPGYNQVKHYEFISQATVLSSFFRKHLYHHLMT